MEQGLKNLQTISRSSRKRKASEELENDRGKEDHEGDSGIGLSDAEADSGHAQNLRTSNNGTSGRNTVQHHYPSQIQPHPQAQPSAPSENKVKRTLAPLPLYQPPPSAYMVRPQYPVLPPSMSAYDHFYPRPQSACPQQPRGNISVQSMLHPMEIGRR